MSSFSLTRPELLFDVDGVLVHPPFRFRDHLERNGGITPEMTAPFFQGRFMACLGGDADLSDELNGFLNGWGWKGTVEDFIADWMEIDSTPDSTLFDFVASLKLRGFRCHVASVQERVRASFLRQDVGFDRVFDKTFFSCELGSAKPDPDFFHKIAAKLTKPTSDLLLVDDSAACIEAALAAGWQAFHYKGPDDIAELAAMLARFD